MTDVELTLNPWDSNPGVRVFCVQGEQQSRTLHITLIDRTGVQDALSTAPATPRYIDLTGYTARMYVKKSDGTKVHFPGTVTDAPGGKVDFTLTGQSVAAEGKADCTITLTNGDVELKVVGMVLDVQKNDLEDSAESADEWVELDVLISRAKNAAESAETAALSADSAKEAANIAAAEANEQAEAAETAAQSANTAANDANTAASAANSVISAAQEAADRANLAADRVEGTEVGDLAIRLAEHTEKLAEHSESIAEHSEILAGHTAALASHAEKLAEHSEALAGIFNAIYPIGSIYMSVAAADPGTLFGGTWERWGKGRVPVGIDEMNSSFDKPEETGGESYHMLTVNEMPAHTHAQNITTNTGKIAYNGPGTFGVGDSTKATGFNTGERGGGKAFSILQPYITCYMWKRIS